MSMPGFTADSSLYVSRFHYKTTAQWGGAVHSAVEMAALRMGRPLNGGTNGCRPHCGPCLPDSTSPTGCTKTCFTAACEDVDISCTGCQITCPSGLSQCGRRCVNLSNDPANCGTCFHSCLSGTCTNGSCAPCPAGTTACGGMCCPPGSCGSAGICCPSGQTNCGGTCCPSGQCCGSSCCSAGQVCFAGACGTPAPPVTQCATTWFTSPSIAYCASSPSAPGTPWTGFSNAAVACAALGGFPMILSGGCTDFSGGPLCVTVPSSAQVPSTFPGFFVIPSTSFCV